MVAAFLRQVVHRQEAQPLALTLALNERWKAPSRFRRLDAVMTPFMSTSKKSNAALSSSSHTRIPPLAFFGTYVRACVFVNIKYKRVYQQKVEQFQGATYLILGGQMCGCCHHHDVPVGPPATPSWMNAAIVFFGRRGTTTTRTYGYSIPLSLFHPLANYNPPSPRAVGSEMTK